MQWEEIQEHCESFPGFSEKLDSAVLGKPRVRTGREAQEDREKLRSSVSLIEMLPYRKLDRNARGVSYGFEAEIPHRVFLYAHMDFSAVVWTPDGYRHLRILKDEDAAALLHRASKTARRHCGYIEAIVRVSVTGGSVSTWEYWFSIFPHPAHTRRKASIAGAA